MRLSADVSEKRMLMPTALFVDLEKKRYYVTDSGNNRLISFDEQGKLINSFNANNSLDTPSDLVRDESGILWVLEKGKNSLTKIDLKNKKVKPGTIRTNGKTVFPSRLEIAQDNLYILNRAGGEVLSISHDLQVLKTYACEDCAAGFIDFKILEDTIYALARDEKAIYQFNIINGTFEKKIVLGETVHFPYSLALESTGLIYVLDRHDGYISVYSMSGIFKYRFLGSGHVQGRLYYPHEISFDPWGRLCVVDEGNGRVEIFHR
ncbi:hypothetical protein ACFL6N_01610 [Thermodesulfobacteriota bacterium]